MNAKPRLLLVEDDRDHLEVLELVLQSEGYEVLTSTNGEEALALLKDQTVDCVVCDYMMPVMNGQSFVQELRKDERNFNLPVLMLTAAEGENIETRMLNAGADAHCTKSQSREVIASHIKELIAEDRS